MHLMGAECPGTQLLSKKQTCEHGPCEPQRNNGDDVMRFRWKRAPPEPHLERYGRHDDDGHGNAHVIAHAPDAGMRK